jgi:hypothetical protein
MIVLVPTTSSAMRHTLNAMAALVTIAAMTAPATTPAITTAAHR